MISAIVVLFGCFIISFVVFGGAQMFIPYFKMLLVNFLNVDSNTWDAVVSIANSTPGVFGLKLAFISGYLAGNGYWWSYFLMFGTYIVFLLVPILIMLKVIKKYQKIKTSQFMINFTKWMRPVLAGILVYLIFNLTLSILVPFVGFNDVGTEFGSLDKYVYLKTTFFKEWRFWALIAWSTISIFVDWFLIRKYKINISILIVVHICLCMIIFQPWLKYIKLPK